MAWNSIASNKMCSLLDDAWHHHRCGVSDRTGVNRRRSDSGNDEDAFTIVKQSAVMETMESVTNTLAWKAARKHPIDALRYSS